MSGLATFMDAVLAGVATEEDIGRWLTEWRALPNWQEVPLNQWLGMTPRECAVFIESPKSLNIIINGRKLKLKENQK